MLSYNIELLSGLCKNKNCKYVHKIMSEQQKKDTGYDKDRRDSNKKTKLIQSYCLSC